jgi:hypothetical protein
MILDAAPLVCVSEREIGTSQSRRKIPTKLEREEDQW